MDQEIIKYIAQQLNVKEKQVIETLKLLQDGNTIPFIARYRKEMTGNLDEEQIQVINKEFEYQENLKQRKLDVIRIIETQGKLTPEIEAAVNACHKLKEVEDIYRPYQQKRKTRATEAIRKGLEPLANYLLSLPKSGDVRKEASKYVKDEVTSIEEAIQGAEDIIAEKVSDDQKFRAKITDSLSNYGYIITKVKKNNPDEEKVYQLYYDHKEKLKFLESHRLMAINRAEKEKVITISYEYDKAYIEKFCYRGLTHDKESIANDYLMEAIKDGLKRLAFPSIENEVYGELLEKAMNKSIDVFALNLEKLLLQHPLKGKMVLGFDPAFRTGCKLAVLDKTGKMLEIEKIYPHAPINKKDEAEKIMLNLFKKYPIEIVAIGNGTASRESESFVASIINKNKLNIQYTLVSEAGASVYSASDIARKEFPDLHVEERSAVSIGRRILDPLAELIKIDPKSIGVGQYQHDLPTKQLEEKLDFAIEKTVNRVGVDVNTASPELLTHIAGFNKAIANSLIEYRNENGSFQSRAQLLKVKKFTDKVFEQASGFLRINQGIEPLDNTSIHPESYKIAKEILAKTNNLPLGSKQLVDELNKLDIQELIKEFASDEFTLTDIIDSLKAPLRDYRDKFDGPVLRSDVLELEDLHIGDKLQGVVRNVVDFGAFVDIGLHEDGLVHKSKLSKDRNVNPNEIVSVNDIIDVYVCGIDMQRHKVSLSLFAE